MRVVQACFQSSTLRAALSALLVSACCPPAPDTSQEQAYTTSASPAHTSTDVPKLARLRIIPDTLHVYAPATAAIPEFQLRVQLRDADGRIIPEYFRDQNGSILLKSYVHEPSWEWSDGTDLGIAGSHHRAVIQLPSASPHMQQLTIRARVGSIEDEASITVIRDITTVPESVVKVSGGGIEPTLVLADGSAASLTWHRDDLRGLVAAGYIRDYIKDLNGSEVVALAPGKGIALVDADWASGKPVDLDLGPMRTLPITILIAVHDPGGAIAQQASMDAELATSVFRSAGAGLRFRVAALHHIQPVSDLRKTHDGCQGSASQVYKAPASSAGLQLSPDSLYVIYVESIFGTAKAFTCHHEIGKAGIVAVSWEDYTPTDVAHELGHAMSLHDPVGHVDMLHQFDRTNIMASWLDHNSAASRTHVAAGQSYRLNLDKWSWFNLDPSSATDFETKSLTLVCPQVDSSEKRCPLLYRDVTN